jgi:hypothetical protein
MGFGKIRFGFIFFFDVACHLAHDTASHTGSCIQFQRVSRIRPGHRSEFNWSAQLDLPEHRPDFQTHAGFAIQLIHFILREPIQRRLKIIEDNRIGKTLENKRKLPKGVDRTCLKHRGNRQNIHHNKRHAETHAQKQEAETRRYSDELNHTEAVAVFDVPEQVDRGEYPPRVP